MLDHSDSSVRIAPQKRIEAIEKIRIAPSVETFTVITGDVDVTMIVEQIELNMVLETLSKIDGILETKTFVSIQTSSKLLR